MMTGMRRKEGWDLNEGEKEEEGKDIKNPPPLHQHHYHLLHLWTLQHLKLWPQGQMSSKEQICQIDFLYFLMSHFHICCHCIGNFWGCYVFEEMLQLCSSPICADKEEEKKVVAIFPPRASVHLQPLACCSKMALIMIFILLVLLLMLTLRASTYWPSLQTRVTSAKLLSSL